MVKSTLKNGLTVLLREMHHAPVASFWVWYRTGSRNDKPGNTGISHWVEHMMFKGSPQFPAGSLDRMISREGGRWNAFTTTDFTAYYETLPANKINLALQLEADRMTGAQILEQDIESERSIIISERHMYENHPSFLLQEALISAAFQVHSYRHEVIGNEADLKVISQADLLAHYRRYYTPNNAVVIAVGDFDNDVIMEQIERLFGGIPGRYQDGDPIPQEPVQDQERRVSIGGPGQTSYLALAFHVPPARHPDFYPLVLLNAAFTGGSSLGFFGSGTTNKSSRLHKALVDNDLAVAVSGTMSPCIDPYLYTIYAIPRPGRSLAEVEMAMDTQLRRLGEEPITQRELDKALKRAKAQFVMAGESVTGQAQMYGLAEMVTDDYHWYDAVLDSLSRVSLTDINRVQATYLRPINRIIATYVPSGTFG